MSLIADALKKAEVSPEDRPQAEPPSPEPTPRPYGLYRGILIVCVGLVLVGIFISITLELCGIHSLSFAVGSYLPISTTAPIFAGGLVRSYVEKRTGVTGESEISSGTLFSSERGRM